jgi:transcriptional regulator with XRE-family HTH domain
MPRRFQPQPLALKVGMRVRELRREKNLSIARLAKASGLSKGHVSNMEHGLVLMTVGTIVAIAKGLDIPPFLLILFPDEDPFGALLERVRIEQRGDPERTAHVLRRMVFGRGGPKRPPPDKDGGVRLRARGAVVLAERRGCPGARGGSTRSLYRAARAW